MTTPDDLSLRLADEIDYHSLDDEILFALAARPGDQFIATLALAELSRRDAPRTSEAATAILTNAWADRHLRAFAITALYGADAERALDVMTTMLERTEDPKLLGAMVECVLADEPRFRAADRQSFTSTLATRVAAVAPDSTTDIDERSAFLEAFGAVRPSSVS